MSRSVGASERSWPGSRRALVFLVIVVTVVVQGLTAKPLARLLGLNRPSNQGFAILGAHALGRLIAGRLRQTGEPVVLLDSNAENCHVAEEEGFRVVYGNALEETVQRRAGMESRRAAIGLLPNGAINMRFVGRARRESHVGDALVALRTGKSSVEKDALVAEDVRMLFGSPRDVDLWDLRLRRGLAVLETWTASDKIDLEAHSLPREIHTLLLPLVLHRGEHTQPLDETVVFSPGDQVEWLLFSERDDDARAWLRETGWVSPAPESARAWR